ncbi:hypothetical protein K1W54_15420 [Micromonospora sp. CPCC 205371]|nr:hypothetical protein [Micromonospora sp. CPCC 205371]
MLTRRFLLSVVALLAAVATAPGPAGAAPGGAARLSFPAEITLPLTADAKRVTIATRVPDDTPLPSPVDARLTLDLADLAGVATVTPEGAGWSCDNSGTTLVCLASGWLPSAIDIDFAPAPGAKQGDSGQMRLTFAVPGLKPATGSMTIATASIVDLADASPQLSLSGVPGDDITWPVRVRNAGQVTIDGVVAFFIRPYRVRFHERHGNCEYAVGFYGRAEYAACRFDSANVPPGATFEVSPVPPMRIAADAAGGDAVPVVVWYTSFDWAKDRERWENDHTNGFTPGTGPPLRLVEAAGLRAGSQTEPDRDNNWGSMRVTVDAVTKADQAAVPATITGRVGEHVTLRLGNHNYGPTSVDWSDPQDEPAVFLQVTVPPGVTVTAAAINCRATKPEPPEPSFVPGAAEYVCGDGSVHPAGETIWFEMTFRINRKVPGAEGRLAIRGFPDLPSPGSWDPNPGNDTAPLKVRVLGGTSGGGSAGGLPITGAGAGTVGVGLVVLGMLLVLAARRRATGGGS